MRGGNLSYVIANESTREAAVVDPGFGTDELKNLISAEDLNLIFVIITHDHIDHVVGIDDLRVRFGAKVVANRMSKCPQMFELTKETLYPWAQFRSKSYTRPVTAPIAYACSLKPKSC